MTDNRILGHTQSGRFITLAEDHIKGIPVPAGGREYSVMGSFTSVFGDDRGSRDGSRGGSRIRFHVGKSGVRKGQSSECGR